MGKSKKWEISLHIQWPKRAAGTFKVVGKKIFESKREATAYYNEMHKAVREHYHRKYGMLGHGWSSFVLNCYGTKTFETPKEWMCIQYCPAD